MAQREAAWLRKSSCLSPGQLIRQAVDNECRKIPFSS